MPSARLLVALLFLWPSICLAGADAPLPAGVRAVWDLDSAARDKTATRERVCLNGLWRWQPAEKSSDVLPAGDWGFTKVPGPWPGSRGDYMWVDSQTYYPAPAWKNADLGKVVVGWYQREFTVPADWAGRRIAVSMEYLYSAAAVYVDGAKVGEAYFPGGEVDISAACHAGGKHVLSVRTAAVPLGEETTYFAENGVGTHFKASVQLRGLCGDVWLTGSPAGARLTDAKIETSVQKWEIAVSAAMAKLNPQVTYRLHARIMDHGKSVHELTSDPFNGSDLKDGRFTFRGGWKPDKLWDLNSPANQYDLQLSLIDEKNAALDTLPEVRFGFREFRIDGRDFRLNGSRFHGFAVPLDSAQISAAASTYSGARETFARLKTFGVNLVYTHNYGCIPGTNLGFTEILRAADDAGMLVSFSMPHVDSYDWKKPGDQAARDYARHAEFYVRAAQNHPAVVMYAMNHNLCGYADEHNPDHIDGRRDMTGAIRQPDDRNAQLALRAQAIVQQIDSTRVIYHHGGANLGQTFTLNIYLNHVPSQERCDWFEHWATEGIKPLFLAEYGTPSDIDWTTYRGWFRGERSWGNGAVTFETCFPEWGAQYRGDKAYDITEKEKANLRWEAKAWRVGKPWHRWDYPYNFPSHQFDVPNVLDVMAMYVADDWRAYRTWGVSAFNSWELERMWTLRPGFSPTRKTLPVEWERLQRPGYSPDFLDRRFEQFEYAYEASDWLPTSAARAVIANNQPLLAYIAGSAAHFTVKDHNYQPGQTIEKQVIVLNDSRGPVTFDCAWTWRLSRPVGGSSRFTVETGEQKRIPIQCELPAGLTPGAYELDLVATPDVGQPLKDTFIFHVLPLPPAAKVSGKVALFDPPGQTAEVLRRLGVAFHAVDSAADLSGYDILIVGKAALTLDAAAPDIARVRDGLKVIVFEQTADVLEKRFGFHVVEYGLRRVFERLPDHPVLAGLSADNLADWRGQATIMPRQLEYKFDKYQTPMIEWCGMTVSHPWRCGNYGNVASVLIEKPGRGDFLPIMDGGFSLQYSPLMEYHEGKGLVLFCQLDVTGRTQADPAGDRLVSSILQYAANFKPAPMRKAIYAGEAAGKTYLENVGIPAQEYEGGKLTESDVLVVGPGGGRALAASAPAIAEFLKAGGHLLAIGLDQGDAQFLPFNIATHKREYITTTFEPFGKDSPLAGVGPADLDNRDPRDIPLIDSGGTIFGNGVLCTAKDANVVFCQLAPWHFDYEKQYNLKRTYRRVSFAVARLLANAGVAAPTPVLSRFASPVNGDKSEPRWLNGLYVDKPEEWDDPYRFFCW
ncbi:MAG: Beta-galactosidase [Phycisphaerales bacterium]|nr:Beta-galactosidase [Phycisphaerales bacterium]